MFDQFKDCFDIRNDVVHKFTIGTELYWERNGAYGDTKREGEVMDKMKLYQDAITESLPSCIKALKLTLKFISETNHTREVYSSLMMSK